MAQEEEGLSLHEEPRDSELEEIAAPTPEEIDIEPQSQEPSRNGAEPISIKSVRIEDFVATDDGSELKDSDQEEIHPLAESTAIEIDLIATDEKFEQMYKNLKQMKDDLDANIRAIETMDLTLNVMTYKLYSIQHMFNDHLNEIREKKEKFLLSNLTSSELSEKLADLELKTLNLQGELDAESNELNQQKLDLQEQYENKVYAMDLDLDIMKKNLDIMRNELERNDSCQSVFLFLVTKYLPFIEEYQKNLEQYSKIQITGWREINSEIRISDILQERGVKLTQSGILLTKSGTRLAFHEALAKGLLEGIAEELQKKFSFGKKSFISVETERTEEKPVSSSESTSTIESDKMSYADIKYLQDNVGKPLTIGLAEIVTKQPRDPIHYLAHWLFKFRYNQDKQIVDDQELEELTAERQRLCLERWHQFVEDEARAIIEEILRRVELIVNEMKYPITVGEGEYDGGYVKDYGIYQL